MGRARVVLRRFDGAAEGKVVDLTAVDVGARLVCVDDTGKVVRIEEAGLNALQTQAQLFYDGWLIRVKLSTDEGHKLMSAEEYEEYVRDEEKKK